MIKVKDCGYIHPKASNRESLKSRYVIEGYGLTRREERTKKYVFVYNLEGKIVAYVDDIYYYSLYYSKANNRFYLAHTLRDTSRTMSNDSYNLLIDSMEFIGGRSSARIFIDNNPQAFVDDPTTVEGITCLADHLPK